MLFPRYGDQCPSKYMSAVGCECGLMSSVQIQLVVTSNKLFDGIYTPRLDFVCYICKSISIDMAWDVIKYSLRVQLRSMYV